MWLRCSGRVNSAGTSTGLATGERCTLLCIVLLGLVSRCSVVYLQMDLHCTEPVVGGYYYPDHLPILGKTIILCQVEI